MFYLILSFYYKIMNNIKTLQAYNHYLNNKEIYNEITIVFSGKNILNNIKFAVNTFLYFYPFLKDNIVIFDDNSTDGTKEWTIENNLKYTSWSSEIRLNYNIDNYDDYFSPDNYNMITYSYKVDLMINDIFSQVNTKYLLINDGDVFFCDYFLEDFINIINKGNKLICNINHCYGTVFEDKKYKNYLDKDYFNELFKYLLSYHNNIPLCNRIHLFHAFIDLDFLKSKNILFDPLNDKYLEYLSFPPVCDSGALFYREILKNKIPYFNWKYDPEQELTKNHIIHLGFRSSFIEMKHSGYNMENETIIEHDNGNFPTSLFYLLKNYKAILNNYKAKNIIDEFQFNIAELFESEENINYDEITKLLRENTNLR